MNAILGYVLREKIHESERSLVYRARRERDGAKVVLKLFWKEHPTPDEVARFCREHDILGLFDAPGIIKAHALEQQKGRYALVTEDFGGSSLASLLAGGPLGVEEALQIAIRVADSLAEIHGKGVIHKDVNPSNIVVHPETREVKIIDFGLSTRISRENPVLRTPNVLEGTLRYISPEQTGRMNRAVDYRTDFYSLGAALYEVLTGAPPFASDDAMELVHQHLAKEPSPPSQRRAEIPRAVSDVILKLLAKSAEERYQSAYGLKADLEECLARLRATGPLESFVPGRHDASDRFQIPQKLYGREPEIASLLDAFDRVAAGGRAEMMLVAGYSGVGKSALVSEIHKPITRRRGYFIAGKFDQLQRDIPYASLIQAFQDLVRQLLTESEERLALFRRALLDALGPNGRVITDVIPEVALIVGEQPPVAELPPAESQNRFNFVFQSFVRCFASEEHPLVIFLDDLQWADSPSLKLIQLLVTDPGTRHLFLVGAYRDNEVSGAHPLLLTLDAIRKDGLAIEALRLAPLDLAHVRELVEDTLRCGPERAAPLARLLLAKTDGNPFFLGQFLRSLHEEGLLAFDRELMVWRWDTDEIERRGFTDNVVELMAGKIQKLPQRASLALELASCIGNHFDLETLAIVAERGRAEAAADLWPAVQEGLLLPVTDAQLAEPTRGGWAEEGAFANVSYRFLHDRVQQAAWSLIPEASRTAIHLRVGRLLLRSAPEGGLEERLFDVVHHLNLARELFRTREERYELARLNLAAGKKAKGSAAFEPALHYLEAGLALLPEGSWAEDHELCFALHAEAMEAHYLNAELERARELAIVAMDEAKTPLEKVKILESRMLFHTARNEIHDTLATAWEALALLGVHLPPPAGVDMPKVIEAMTATAQRVGDRRPLDLFESLPAMTDPQMMAALRIMSTAGAPTYITSPLAFPVLVCAMVDICLAHGNAATAPYGWASYGLLQTDVATANAWGDVAIRTVERFGALDKAKTLVVVNICIRHWKIHTRETLEPLLEGIKSAQEVGDIEFVGYGADHYCKDIFYVGEPLDFVDRECGRYIDLMTAYKQEFNRLYLCVIAQAVQNLMGRSASPTVMTGEAFDEATMLLKLVESNNNTSLCPFYVCRASLAYLFGDYDKALADSLLARQYLGGVAGMNVLALQCFYEALARLAVLDRANDEERAAHLAAVDEGLAKLEKWAKDGPANYLHRFHLVEAERARARGELAPAMDAYERAIHAAAEHRYVQDEALAYERAAAFHLAAGRTRIGEAYLTEARYGYVRWGAAAKVAELDRRFPVLFAPKQAVRRAGMTTISSGPSSTSSTSSSSGAALDLTTIMKAAQAIAREIELESLLDALMRNVVENAGAQRGVLLLEREGRLALEAEWSVGGAVVAMGGAPLAGARQLSEAIVNYVARTGENVILSDAVAEGLFTKDPYVLQVRPKSVLAAPLVNQGKLVAILYLENNLTAGAFTRDRLAVLRVLLAQAALSIHNAHLYASLKESNEKLEEYSRTLEERVTVRTRELKDKHDELAATLAQLRTTQKQLVTQEKLASLGALTAGIAHEIKNPLNFVNNFAELSVGLADEIGDVVSGQRSRMEPWAASDLEAALDDLRQNVQKINEHGKRANGIINGMLLHARDTASSREAVSVNAIVAECVDLAYHGMRGKDPGFQVSIDASYDPAMGPAEVAAADMSRVFINVLNNACYATQQKKRALGPAYQPRLTVRTKDLGESVEVRIHDNGIGIPKDVIDKIYNPFFTTKPPGEGTGLGLSLSYDIVVHGHQGTIRADTSPGEFTEFIVTLPKHPSAHVM